MTKATAKPEPLTRAAFAHFFELQTRWMDNDIYGHVNNVVYYSYFDTAVNRYLIDNGALDIQSGKVIGQVIGLVVENHCNFFKPIAFPDRVHAGLRVAQFGNSSVRYEIALFRNDDDSAAAQGHFVHVYVERATSRPVPLPDAFVKALKPLAAKTAG